jgi:hypothetical protein
MTSIKKYQNSKVHNTVFVIIFAVQFTSRLDPQVFKTKEVLGPYEYLHQRHARGKVE